MKYIKKPKLSLCPNKKTKYPPTNINPLYHINAYLIKMKSDIIGINYDGYIVNKSSKEITHFLLLREYDASCNLRDIWQSVFDEMLCGNRLCQARIAIANDMNIPFSIFLIPEDYPYLNQDKTALIINNITDCCNIPRNHFMISNMREFISFINNFRGGPFKYKAKGLSAANTKFECYLANEYGYTPFPGDLDGLLIRDNRALAILEFKTHNLDTPIEDQYLGQYGKEDWRRIEVLHNLKEYLNVPIYVIFWGPKHSNVKIDKIIKLGEVKDSRVVNWGTFPKTLLSMVK